MQNRHLLLPPHLSLSIHCPIPTLSSCQAPPTQVYLAYNRGLALRLPLFDRPCPKNGSFCNLGVLDLLHYVPQPINQGEPSLQAWGGGVMAPGCSGVVNGARRNGALCTAPSELRAFVHSPHRLGHCEPFSGAFAAAPSQKPLNFICSRRFEP